MDEDPYRAPATPSHEKRLTPPRLQRIAGYQRRVVACIALQAFVLVCLLVAAVLFMGDPQGPQALSVRDAATLAIHVGFHLAGMAVAFFAFLLGAEVYNGWVGASLAIVSLVPCVGMFVLLIVCDRVTALLRRNDVHVGLLGAISLRISRLGESDDRRN